MWLKDEVEFGIYTDGKGNVVQAICDFTESYIDKNIGKVYFPELLGLKSGWLGFEVADTQKYDDAMASGFCFIAAKNKKYLMKSESVQDIESILPYHKIA